MQLSSLPQLTMETAKSGWLVYICHCFLFFKGTHGCSFWILPRNKWPTQRPQFDVTTDNKNIVVFMVFTPPFSFISNGRATSCYLKLKLVRERGHGAAPHHAAEPNSGVTRWRNTTAAQMLARSPSGRHYLRHGGQRLTWGANDVKGTFLCNLTNKSNKTR